MIKIEPERTLTVGEIYSKLVKGKTTATSFKLPYTVEQARIMLYAACKATVEKRGREFAAPQEYLQRLHEMAQWLTSDHTTFGLLFCGNVGNGKTTLALALQSLYFYVHSDEGLQEHENMRNPYFGFEVIPSKELVLLAKAYNSPTRDNSAAVQRYKRLRDTDIVCIDDLGTEPRESVQYGEFVTAAIDFMNYRYANRYTTLATSNLAPKDFAAYYDERLYDRFREMMKIINFGNAPSYRRQNKQ